MDGIIGSLTGFVGGITDWLTGGTSIGQAYGGFTDLFAFLNSWDGWRRIFFVLFGGLLIFGGIRYGTE